ncbi:zinc-ribbon domain-containing protein [Iodidimonas sp. SYSU 1G8]|uniref:zinc-ribbon domain-containing protein n=1 Tax=Iodidimonas sp. SYSU 1G8 TaxID=3133967 RepID=UPI0031FEA123
MIITCPNCSTRYTLPQDKIKPGGQRVRCAKCGNVWHQQPDEAAAPEPVAEPVFVPPSGADLPADAAAAMPPDEAPPAAAAPPAPAEPAPAAAGFADFHQETKPLSGSKEELVRPRPGDDGDDSGGAGRKWAIAAVILVVFALGAAVLFKDQLAALTGLGGPAVTETAAPAASEAPPAPVPEEPVPMTLDFENVESSVEEIDGIRYLQLQGVLINKGDRKQTVPPLSFEMRDKDGNSLGQWVFEVETQTLEPFAKAPFKSRKDLPPVALYELVPGFSIPGQAQAGTAGAAPGEAAATAEGAPAAGTGTPAQPAASAPATN